MGKLHYQINTRQRSIISTILESDPHITLKEIAEKTQLSVRVIRYNMETVLSWFHNEEIEVVSRPGYGYDFDIPTQQRKELLRSLSDETDHPISLTRNQRQRIGLLELLISNRPISFQYLASNECISRSTVVTDTEQMQKWLNKYKLSLVKTPNKGTYVEGSEFIRRRALIDLIREEIGFVKYYSIWVHHDMSFVLDRSLPNTIEEYLRELPLSRCFHFLEYIEQAMGMQLALFSRVEILLYLAITVQTLESDAKDLSSERTFFKQHYDIDSNIEKDVSSFIMNKLGMEFDLPVDDFERSCMALNLLFAKWDNEEELVNGENEYSGNRTFNISQDALVCADMMTAACANQLHPLLQTDEELVMNLARHFHTCFNQIKYDYPIVNENLEMILDEYPEIFRSVNSEVSLIEDQIGKTIPPEEIGYIVMYMVSALNKLQTEKFFKIPVVILGDGIRTKSIFLKDRLQLFFPTLQVVSLMNGYPEEDNRLDKADLVLSLIPGVFMDIPVIEVSPFLTQQEIRTIQNWIIGYEERNRDRLMSPTKKPDLVDLLHTENILLNVDAESWEDVIRLASKPLQDQKLIKPEFCEAMIDITRQYGPYTILAPGVVLLNARPNDGVNKVCMSLLTLNKPVSFGDTADINMAFVLGASDNHSHLNALFQLSKVCEHPEFLELLRNAGRASEVLRAIWIHSSEYNLSKLV